MSRHKQKGFQRLYCLIPQRSTWTEPSSRSLRGRNVYNSLTQSLHRFTNSSFRMSYTKEKLLLWEQEIHTRPIMGHLGVVSGWVEPLEVKPRRSPPQSVGKRDGRRLFISINLVSFFSHDEKAFRLSIFLQRKLDWRYSLWKRDRTDTMESKSKFGLTIWNLKRTLD